MKFIYIAFVLALLTLSVAAQDNKNAPPAASTSILINGQSIKGKVLEIDGKHFVAVEDLAQSLRGTISYGDGQIALTLSQLVSMTSQPPSSQLPSTPPQPQSSQLPRVTEQPPSSQLSASTPQPPASQIPSMTAQSPETGRIRGTLTYFFDFHNGNKPDTGSKIWLVHGRVEIPANQNFVATSIALGTTGNPEQYNAIKYSIADEHGTFELLDIPPGQYTLILQSAHTVGTLKEKRDFFGKGNSRSPRDSTGRVESLNLVVKAGDTVDASKDFGPNTDR